LSHNVLVAIDARRNLNNGHPSFLAWLIDQLELKEGQSVCHVGAGTGYYSAILASMVGKAGRVVAIEVDDALARRARQNLRGYRQVEVVGGDGFSYNAGPVDAILVNAGVNHLSSTWLQMLRPGGRLVVPLTLKNGGGRILKATRGTPRWGADLSDTSESTRASAQGAGPPRFACRRLLPPAWRRSVRCDWTTMQRTGIAGCTIRPTACRSGIQGWRKVLLRD
jgi:protein-L-isoaspartate O-methyltransferase